MHILKAKLLQIKQKTNETQALQTQSSLHNIIVCEVRSKYFKTWAKRQIYVSLDEKLLYMICPTYNKKKSYHLDQVSYTRNPIQQTIKLKVSPSRNYEIKTNHDLEQLLKDIQYYHNFKLFSTVQLQLKTEPPKKIFYHSVEKKPHLIEPVLLKKKSSEFKKQAKIQKVYVKPLVQYERQTSYIKESDWKRDKKNGGLLFINEQRKHIISQMISYTAKKIVSSGSFTTINFPTFAMKPESALQNYCKCLGAAPLLLQNIQPNPIQRMKAFNVIILSLSIQLNDIEKPFNALLGQTYQGQIGGYSVYAQQISTKPNVSCFLLMGKNYRLYGNLELKANIGLNQAVGVFHGQITLEFDDGAKIVGIMPKGVMSGVIFGDTKFGPTGAVYSYDPNNNIVCSYETVDTDEMVGQIGILKHTAQQKFIKKVKGKNVQQFPYFAQKDFETILSRMHVVYTDSISYDGKSYFRYSDKKNLPIKLTQQINKKQKKLPSDSSFRQDIKLRKNNNIKDSQKINDDLQNQQQRIRKLRKNRVVHKNY